MSRERIACTMLQKRLRTWQDRIDRVESQVVTGMPDINFCLNGVEGWIEVKAPIEPKRNTSILFASNHKLSTAQKNWFLRQRQAKGRCYVFISTDKRYMMIDGEFADQINGLTVDRRQEVSLWSALKKTGKCDWEELRKVLTR